MPQDLSALDPEDYPSEEEKDNQYSSSSDLCEQLGLNCQYEDYQSTKQFYTAGDLRVGKQILNVLRNSNSPLTKRQLAAKIYPKIFGNNVLHYCDEYGIWWNLTKQIQKQYVDSVGKQLRAITHDIICNLDKCTSKSEELNYLKTVSLAMPITTDSRCRAKYLYQGPDASQPLEVLKMFREWARAHQFKNSQLLRLAERFCEGTVNSSGILLDPDDYPGQEVDQQLNLDLDAL